MTPKVKTRLFDREWLLEEALEGGEGVEVLVNEVEDASRRWSVDYDFVFKFEGKCYRCGYSVGATESQDESPWEYDVDTDGMVTAYEVEPKEVTVIEYVDVKE